MSPAFEMNATHKAIMMEVIDMYKTMSYLWDQSHPSYQDRPLRMKAYKKLLEKYQEIDKDATIALVKAKLDNMRTGYARELKKVRESVGNSLKCTDQEPCVYRPCLWYYDLLNFLEDTILRNTNKKKHKREQDRDTPEFVLYDDFDDDASQHNTEYSLPAEYLEEDHSDTDSSTEITPKRHKHADRRAEPGRDGDWEVIGKAIGVQLKDVEPRQAAIAQKLIAEAIFYARLNRLTEDSTVCIN